MEKTIIVRYGELALKSESVRRRFERCLIRNITEALKDIDHRISKERGRIFVETSSEDEALDRLTRVPGVVSVSPASKVEAEIDAICSSAMEVAKGILVAGRTFAVRTRRVGRHTFSSGDVSRAVGSAILETVPGSKVDLSNPDLEVGVEVRGDRAYVFTSSISGPGGLPVGTEGTVAALVSGGVDSAVAAYLMMKRGCGLIPIYFDNRPFTNEATMSRARCVLRKISGWSAGSRFHPYIVPYGSVLGAFVERAPRKLTCVLCKRGMYRIAEEIDEKEGARGIVTGEVLGQVGSQTLDNLCVLDEAVSMPVFRPIVGLDKVEVEGLARRIGTYEISIRPAKGCTAAPRHPETRADLNRVKKVEEDLNVAMLMEEAVRKAEILDILANT